MKTHPEKQDVFFKEKQNKNNRNGKTTITPKTNQSVCFVNFFPHYLFCFKASGKNITDSLLPLGFGEMTLVGRR